MTLRQAPILTEGGFAIAGKRELAGVRAPDYVADAGSRGAEGRRLGREALEAASAS